MTLGEEEENIDTYTKSEINDKFNDKENEIRIIKDKLSAEIINLKQEIKGNKIDDLNESEFLQAYESIMAHENRPQLNSAGLAENNKHTSLLSNHELQQMKSVIQKDHRKKPVTVLDEPVGVVLDKTINFLGYSFEEYEKKIYEAELMENIRGDKSFYETVKLHVVASSLFFRDKDNILYIGFILVFISIIIYFISIITINDQN